MIAMAKKSKSISDQRVLEMILAGMLTLRIHNLFDPNPIILRKGRILTPYILEGRSNPRYHIKVHSHYQLIRGKSIRFTRTIVRSKLVWMIWHSSILPYGHQIHHIDEDRFNDSPLNLEDKTKLERHDYHYNF